MSRTINVNVDVDIDISDVYDELYDSDKEELVEWLKEYGFIDDVENDVSDKFKNLKINYFRFTKEDEEILETLFNKYNV